MEEKTYASYDRKSKRDLGMEVSDITQSLARRYSISEEKGVIVTYVERGSPAEMEGIREGDVIVEINREPVENVGEYYKHIETAVKNDQVLFLIERKGGSLFVVIPLNR